MELDTVVCGDCLDVMRDMPDGCVDLSFADPPYNVGIDYGNGKDADSRDDYLEWCGEWYRELRRITNGGIFITSGVGNLAQWMNYEPTWILSWHKPFSLRRVTLGMINNWEPVLMFGTPKPSPNQDYIKALLYQDGKSWHPCPKPIGLLVALIEQSTETDAIIFDPFIGSGTTAVAALKLGRHFYGCDINPDYVRLANERIEKTRLEMSQIAMDL